MLHEAQKIYIAKAKRRGKQPKLSHDRKNLFPPCRQNIET